MDPPPGIPTGHDKEILGLTGEWQTIPVTVDSGAVDTVGPRSAGTEFPIVPTRESEMGIGYRAANGSPIKNFGERTLEGHTEDGQPLRMKMTVVDVSKVLASVARICECNNRVVFDEDGSYIEDKESGSRMAIHKKNGVYVMNMKVRKSPSGPVSTVETQLETDFRRLGHDLI